MAVLRQHYLPLAELLDKVEINNEEFIVEKASTGAPTLFYRGIYIHSKRDPEREAERHAGADLQEDKAPALVLGFGLGYTATALVAKFPGRPIIIVEKRIEILKKALELRDFTSFLLKNRLAFVFDAESVIGALSIFSETPALPLAPPKEVPPPLLIHNRPLCNIDKEWYEGLEESIRAWYSQSNVNQATQKRFGVRWEKNLSKNLLKIRDTPGISRLNGMLHKTSIPVFLAAAGPSLDQTGHLLAEIHKRCLIIAVDTSLRFLNHYGIDADFMVSVDPQYWNSRHLDRTHTGKTRLITESTAYPAIFRHSFAAVYLAASFFPPGRSFESELDPKGELAAGGSVATSAWDFARYLGAKEIWIAGLDLSFPDYKTHFRGAFFEEKSFIDASRFAPVESWSFHSLRDGHPFLTKKAGGGLILTDKRLSIYAAWFDNRFKMFPHIKNYRLEGTGIDLSGLETGNKADFLALGERRKEINGLLAEFDKKITEDFFSPDEKEIRSVKFNNILKLQINKPILYKREGNPP